MRYKMKGLDKYIERLESLSNPYNAQVCIENAVTEGSKVVSQMTLAELEKMPVDNRPFVKDGMRTGVTQKVKNELIKSLQDSNKQKDDFIQEQSKKLTELLEQSNILLQNNQLLLADKKKDKKEDIVVNDAEIVNESIDDSPEDKDNENNDNINKEKKGFFSRLFGR